MTEILVSDGGSCNLSNSHNLINLIKDFQNYYYLLLLCSFFLSPDDGSDNLSNLSNYAFFQLDNYYYYYKKENSTYSMFNLLSSHSFVFVSDLKDKFLQAFIQNYSKFRHSFSPKASTSTEQKASNFSLIKF